MVGVCVCVYVQVELQEAALSQVGILDLKIKYCATVRETICEREAEKGERPARSHSLAARAIAAAATLLVKGRSSQQLATPLASIGQRRRTGLKTKGGLSLALALQIARRLKFDHDDERTHRARDKAQPAAAGQVSFRMLGPRSFQMNWRSLTQKDDIDYCAR